MYIFFVNNEYLTHSYISIIQSMYFVQKCWIKFTGVIFLPLTWSIVWESLSSHRSLSIYILSSSYGFTLTFFKVILFELVIMLLFLSKSQLPNTHYHQNLSNWFLYKPMLFRSFTIRMSKLFSEINISFMIPNVFTYYYDFWLHLLCHHILLIHYSLKQLHHG